MGLFYQGAGAFIGLLAAGISVLGGGRAALVPTFPPPGPFSASQTALIANSAAPSYAAPAPKKEAGVGSGTGATGTDIAFWNSPVTPGVLPRIVFIDRSSAVPQARREVFSPAPVSAPALTTASAVLAHTAISLSRSTGGAFALSFMITENGATLLQWPYGTAEIGGTAGIPQFAAAYSCNPPPDGASGQSAPVFGVRTNYDCTLSLTPLSGSDRRTVSQDFPFLTGPGEFEATPPANMDTYLSSGMNEGGFVFVNGDTQPISVLSETFNVSYSYLATAYGPLILRLKDPADSSHYLDYHLENIPAASSSPDTYLQTGVTFSWPITIPANGAKLFPLELFGAHPLSINGTEPSLSVTLSGFTTDRTDIDITPGIPSISWYCVVATSYYNPNATSGPYAAGDACGG